MSDFFGRGAAIAALFAGAFAASPSTAEIGVLAAVNRDMTGARPAEQARPIFINERLVADETIETSGNGGGQVLFLDQTSLTIAPNSRIVLDQYVYDPDADSGAIGITVARGAMRMIGGRITKTSPAVISTPSATIGIRGGMGNISVSEDGTLYMHVAGISSRIQTSAGELTITQQGGLARIGADGALDYLGIATSDIVQQVFSAAATGSGGGGISASSDVSGAGGAVGGQVSGSDGVLDATPISTTGERTTGSFGDLTIDLEVEPTEEFAAAEIQRDMMDDLPSPTDAVAYFGDYSGVVVADNQQTTFDNGAIILALSLSSGEGGASIAFPFAVSGGDADGLIGDIVALRDVNGTFEGVGNTALGGTSEGNLTVEGAIASGNFLLNYEGSALPIEDVDGRILQSVSGTFALDQSPDFPSQSAQELIDAAQLLANGP